MLFTVATDEMYPDLKAENSDVMPEEQTFSEETTYW